MYKVEFLLKFIASVEIRIVEFPVMNPAVVSYDTLKTHFTFSAYSLVPGECVINFILFIYLFFVMLCNVLTEMPLIVVLSDYTKR